MNKKQLVRSLILVSFSMVFFVVSVISAYLLFVDEDINTVTVGKVLVEIDSYFIVNNNRVDLVENSTVENGVVILNITSSLEDNFFDNFRVDLKVKSSVDTYFRVVVYEQFTLTSGASSNITEIAVTRDTYSEFLYNDDFYDNREVDDYFYYKYKTIRNSEIEPKTIPLILKRPDYTHPIYEAKYTIKIGVLVEAVQSLNGPEINWGLNRRPWDNLNW